MENQSTYRIRTKVGEDKVINIPVNLMQEYNSFELLSLKINTDDTYRSYTSTEGIVVGRVSTANNGLGIPNVRVSIFVPRGAYDQTAEEAVLYPFSSPTDIDGDRVRYNLLPTESDVQCYQVIGTMPSKRRILDNETVCEIFEKYYKYTTVTNEAGDFMLTNIPVGKQRLHIDADLSDIGPILSQKPYNMIENLGFEKNKFESTTQFKTSKDLDSLVQVISQNKSVYVYPYWGDATENSAEMKITRTDLSLNYEFKTQAIFMGSVITDKQSNSIRENCTATEKAGKMSEMVTGPGRIEMIRKTVDNKVEQHRVKGDALINDNGVWCYAVPMNLDYVCTDEFGNIVQTDNPNKGIPTRARVRFRITLNEMESDNDTNKRCSYLVPNNPKIDDEKFLEANEADYSFGSDTWDESFVDLFWNKVYTVKNYVPRIQKTVRPTNQKHTGIKMVNHFGDNNPFPYNNMSIKLNFLYRLICVIVHIFIILVSALNVIISLLGTIPCKIANIKIAGWRPFKFAKSLIPTCIELSSDFCDDGVNKMVTFPGCSGCVWDETRSDCSKEQRKIGEAGGEEAECTSDEDTLYNCVENQLAQQNEATSFNFENDWINGCLYMPLWYRYIRAKHSVFFGLFKRRAKNQWCDGERPEGGRQLKMVSFCSHRNSKEIQAKSLSGKDIRYRVADSDKKDGCGNGCHETIHWFNLNNGVIMSRDTLSGTETNKAKAWYYKAVEVSTADNSTAIEYLDSQKHEMVAKILYATDIVLLGSLTDCDMNGIPKFFNYLKGSTYNMPTDVLFSDTEYEYVIEKEGDKDGNFVQNVQKISVASGCDWGNKNEYGYDDGGLFYSIGCSEILVNMKSCVNLRRICELGVGLDKMQYVENIDVEGKTGVEPPIINNETDELDLDKLDYYLRPDGFVSYDDIVDFDYRSMFATMNGNGLKTKINQKTGIKEYDFRHFYIDNFDGALTKLMTDVQSNRNKANYRYNHNLEIENKDYLLFRMGERPYFYDGNSLVMNDADKSNNGPGYYTIPKYQNSFYFYFGLKEGKTAIDLFNQQYNEPCATEISEEESIPYNAVPNGWCVSDGDVNDAANKPTYNHKNYDGYLRFNFENIPLPCTAILNSRNNNSVTYTITDKNNNANITDEKICLYGEDAWKGDNAEEAELIFKDYQKYYLKYENTSINDFPEEGVNGCEMVNNGEYELYVTDSEGNYHSFIVDIKGKRLQFDDVEQKFGQPNNVLTKYYKPSPYSPYYNVAISPSNNGGGIGVTIGEGNVPNVKRVDNEGTNKLINTQMKLNGTICIYNVVYQNEELSDFLIEVEPYDKIKGENGIELYSDKDFWIDSEAGYETWYQVKMMAINEGDVINCYKAVVDVDGKNVSKESETPFFYKGNVVVNNKNINCYIIKCPKGDVNYRVRVTQLCKDKSGRYFKTQNYVERKLSVGQPSPYKLYINGVDYDIIKDFNTGWILSSNSGMQTSENPFEYYRFDAIKGWDEISNINKNYNWEADEELYGKNTDIFEKFIQDDVREEGKEEADDNCSQDEVGEYKLICYINRHLAKEPMWPQESEDVTTETESDESYDGWLEEHEEWERTYQELLTKEQKLLNRLKFISQMKSAFWLQCEDGEKNIVYTVSTDNTPSSTWTIYNDEYVSQIDDDYNETESKPKGERNSWKCKSSSERNISGIKVPTITAYDSKYFGISEDSIRQKDVNSYNVEKTKCFAQDNIAENSEEKGSITIKPPYLIACVDSDGITKPENLTKGDFFAETTNSYGLQKYEFGDVDGNKQYVMDRKGNNFFGFHLIDKIFSTDIVCWSYINDIPYYLPYVAYNTSTKDVPKLGKKVKVSGIVSGNILNGITNSAAGGIVDDFEERTMFNKNVQLKTFNGASEDDIPTRRCILNDKKDTILNYTNYRHTTHIDGDENQYCLVPNRQGNMDFVDNGSNCELERTLYGSMSIALKTSTLNDCQNEKRVLSLNCRNGDNEKMTTYYIFKASMEEDGSKGVYYPINAFNMEDNKFTLDCKCDGNDEKQWVWKGNIDTAQYFFNKNTSQNIFKDKNNNSKGLVDKDINSQIQYENSDNETEYKETKGYGNTGMFTNLSDKAYFVVGVTDNECRTVSPVYDFQSVEYVIGLVNNSMNEKVLRIALVNVLDENYKPRNYYLTQFDFTMDYVISSNDTTITNSNIPFEKSDEVFKANKEECTEIGDSYIKEIQGDEIQYVICTYTGGSFVDNGVVSDKPSGTQITNFQQKYKFKYGDLDNKKEYWQVITFKEDGKYEINDDKKTEEPTEGVEINMDGSPYYIEVKVETTTNGQNGQSATITETQYHLYEYVDFVESTPTKTDPRIPYFMRVVDKVLSNDEYETLNSLMSGFFAKNILKELVQVYVTDVTGLKHRCKLNDVIKSADKWKTLNKIF